MKSFSWLSIVIAILGACVVFAFAGSWLRRRITRPDLFPYTMSLAMRLSGIVMNLGWKLKVIPGMRARTSRELIDCLMSTRAHQLLPLSRAYVRLDDLETIRKGNEALGLSSIFDTFCEAVRLKQSPYTHPLQKPNFFIPGVPAKPFYNAADFGFTRMLEDAYAEIRAELEGLLERSASRFQAYVGGDGMVQPGWNNFYFYLFDKRNEENCAACPKTVSILDSIPRLEKTMAMFAALNPGSMLPPHTGPANGILRVHLPLIVPDKCRLKVGDEERRWEAGKLMIFDDSFVHEVENRSDNVRIVLFFSIYHPCFRDDEIGALQDFGAAWRSLPVTQLYENFQLRLRPGGLLLKHHAVAAAAAPAGQVGVQTHIQE